MNDKPRLRLVVEQSVAYLTAVTSLIVAAAAGSFKLPRVQLAAGAVFLVAVGFGLRALSLWKACEDHLVTPAETKIRYAFGVAYVGIVAGFFLLIALLAQNRTAWIWFAIVSFALFYILLRSRPRATSQSGSTRAIVDEDERA